MKNYILDTFLPMNNEVSTSLSKVNTFKVDISMYYLR